MRGFMALLLMASTAQAEVPKVLTDIAPVQSLTAQVMGTLGTPEMLISAKDDPHHFQMRPSQARLMAGADLVIWMGKGFTPWLPHVIESLGTDVTSLELLDAPDLAMVITNGMNDQRTDIADGDADGDRDKALDDNGDTDPHAWLDPQNAQVFLTEIANALASADPQNAATYRSNAATARTQITAMQAEITAQLAPASHITLVPYHNAYRYFFARFGLKNNGTLASSEATPPSAAHLAEVRDLLARQQQTCLFAEPGANLDLIRAAAPFPDQPVAALDPLGATLTPGPQLYETLIRKMADTIATCETP